MWMRFDITTGEQPYFPNGEVNSPPPSSSAKSNWLRHANSDIVGRPSFRKLREILTA
jgi:hypothetical protein